MSYFFVLLLFVHSLFSEEITPDAFFIDANLTGLPSSLVQGVNVITGTYHDHEEDLVVPNILPIHIQRSYCSHYTQDQWFEHHKSLGNGWGFNYDGALRFSFLKRMEGDEGQHKRYYFYGESYEGGGVCLLYEDPDRIKHKSKHDPFKLKIADSVTKHGFTNCGSGQISARTNPQNNRLFERIDAEKKPYFEMVEASGNTLLFEKSKKEEDEEGVYYLKKHHSLNKGDLKYSYDKENRLTKIEALSISGKPLGFVDIHYKERYFSDEVGMTIQSSDQQQSEYSFAKFKKKYFLESVKKADGTLIKYSYESKLKHHKEGLHQIVKKEVNGFPLSIEYYHRGKEKLFNETIKIDDLKDKRHGRVKCLKAPSGVNGEEIATHTFIYKDNLTHLYDALNNRTDFAYDHSSRLTDVIKISPQGEYYRDKYYWTHKGNLISHAVISEGKNLFCHFFDCDKKGNLIGEWCFGNLTGKNVKKVEIDKTGTPIQNGCEGYLIKRSYSKPLNLLTKEDNGRKVVEYGYVHGDLLEHRFILNKGTIFLREFREYNEDGFLIKKIFDDGNSKDKNILQNVSERHITTYTPSKKPYGLPAVIEEKYLDLSTLQEVLIKKIENSYSLKGEIIEQKHYDSMGNYACSLFWEYNPQGKVTKEIDALGNVKQYAYDIHGNLIEEKFPNGTIKKYTYDGAKRLRKDEEFHKSGEHFVKTFSYNELGQKISETDILGNATYYAYDSLGRNIETIKPAFLSDQGVELAPHLKTVYNALGHPIIVEDAKGNKTKTSFTIRGQPYLVEYPDGSTEIKEYTVEGLMSRFVDRTGVETRYSHDLLGRIIKEEHYVNNTFIRSRSFHYNAFHLLKETDFMGVETEFKYDGAGRLIRTKKENSVVEYAYDSFGRINTCKNYDSENSFTATFREYDLLNRLIEEKIEDQEGNLFKKETYKYDVDGNKIEIITHSDEGLAVQKTIYNGYKKPIKIIDAKGNTTHIQYFYNKIMSQELTDPNGHQVITHYDTHGRIHLLQHKDCMGTIIKEKFHYYDLNGSLVKTKEINHCNDKILGTFICRWEYDSMGRLLLKVEGEGSFYQKKFTLQYNHKGQKESVLQPNGVTLFYFYDELGRLNEQKSSDNTVWNLFFYDVNNNPTLIEDKINQNTTLRSYNALNLLTEETLANQLSFKYEYDFLGRIKKILYPDQSEVTYFYKGPSLKEVMRKKDSIFKHSYDEYNLQGLLKKATLIGNCGTINFTYDENGWINSFHSPAYNYHLKYDGAGNLIQNGSKGYKYNGLYQLEDETDQYYTYDSLHNILSKNDSQYTVNEMNQLIQENENNYQYDLNGNLIQKNNDKYFYDALNRLIAVEKPQDTIKYYYDGLNRRIKKTHQNKTTHYLYIDQDEVGSCDEEGNVLDLRVLGLKRGGENNASILMEIKNKMYCPIHDHNGNVISLLLAETGEEIEKYTYTAYGEEEKRSYLNAWRFSGKRVDEETDLIFFGRRYYDPKIARWLTCDPLSDSDGPNLYAYLHNNPLTHFDAYGLYSQFGNAFLNNFSSWQLNTPTKMYNYEGKKNVAEHMSHENYFSRLDESEDLLFDLDYGLARRGKSSTFKTAGTPLEGGLGTGYINGILNTFTDCQKSANILSQMAGGKMIYGIHNQSYGACEDLSESMEALYYNQISDSVKLLHQQWNDFLSKSDKPFLQICHSQGALYVKHALLTFPEELRKRIIVLAVAPAAYISNDICMKSDHYISEKDIVPMFDKSLRNPAEQNVHILKSLDPTSWIDHSFDSPTYANHISTIMDDYRNTYGKKR